MKAKKHFSLYLLCVVALSFLIITGFGFELPQFLSIEQSGYIQFDFSTIFLKLIALLVVAGGMVAWARERYSRREAEHIAFANEQKYKYLIDNSAFIVFTVDLEGTLTYLSKKSKEITGFRSEELIGENFFDLVEEGWKEKAKEFFAAHRERSTLDAIMELPVISKNGERNWIEQSVVLLENNYQPIGFQIIAKNISEKKFAEKLLEDAHQKIKEKQTEYQDTLQSILDNIPMIVYLKNMEGNIFMVNKTFHDVFDTTDEDVLGHHLGRVHKDVASANRFTLVDEEIKRTLQPVELEDVLLTGQGEKNMLVVKFPLLDKQGKMFAIGSVGKDITDNVRYQKQLIQARIRAEQAEKLQEEFLANMSHEIRTPMNGIIGMTDLLATTPLNEEQNEYLTIIRQSSGILLSLINDILDLSKIKAGRMTLETIDFDIKDTISCVMAPLKARAKEKNISLEADINDNLPTMVKGDQHKLKQILMNLLGNAVKFTEVGKVSLSVHEVMRTDKDLTLEFVVSDTGIGISEENLNVIFESFTQAGNDMVRRFGGTGLGLAITKKLIELQEGNISVASKYTEGTTFTFSLKYELSDKKEAVKKQTEEVFMAREYALQGRKILLVEDNLINQQVTKQILTKSGLEVFIANHGKEAIDMLTERNEYDAILMDLQMAEMDGFQTTAYIRSKMQLQTPIIAMTASALRDEKTRCFEVGMDEYLTKPFSPQALFFHLNRLINKENSTASPKTQKTAPELLYSLDYLAQMEDDDYAAEVLELFLNTTPEILTDIKQHILQEKWIDVSKKAHSLKSSLGILQMTELLRYMNEIEVFAAKLEQFDRIRILINDSINHFNLIKPMLESELESLKQKKSASI